MKPRSLTGAFLSFMLSAIAFHALAGADARSTYRPSLTDFPCPSAGFFNDPGSCNFYYKCTMRGGQLFPRARKCPKGSFFDDYHKDCLPEISLTSPPRCLPQPPSNPTQPPLDSTQDEVDPIEEIARVEHIEEIAKVEPIEEIARVEPTEEIARVEPTEEIDIVDPTEDIAIVDPTEEIAIVEPTEEIAIVEPTEEIAIVEPTEVIVPEPRLCDHISRIDTYATTVISTPELQKSVEYAEKYNKIHTRYNKVLSDAQNFTQLWRHGESIFREIKRTYNKASQYEGEFNRMREINERQIQNLAKQNTTLKSLKSLKNDINNLEQDISTAEEALKHTTVEAVRQFFLTTIESKRQSIEEKRQAMKSTSLVSRQLSERVIFLEYIRDDAREVSELATKSQSQVTGVLGILKNDSESFEKFVNRTNNHIGKLMKEEKNVIMSKNNKLTERDQLEQSKIIIDKELNTLNDDNQRLRNDMSDVISKMEKKTEDFNIKREILCEKHILKDLELKNETIIEMKVNETIEYLVKCENILQRENVILDLSEEREEMRVLEKDQEENRINLENYLGKLNNFTQQMRIISDVLPGYEQRLDEIAFELGKLKSLQDDLNTLKEGVSNALGSFSALELELQELIDTFGDLERDLEGEITASQITEGDKAKQHQTDAIKLFLNKVQSDLSQIVFPDVTCPQTRDDI